VLCNKHDDKPHHRRQHWTREAALDSLVSTDTGHIHTTTTTQTSRKLATALNNQITMLYG